MSTGKKIIIGVVITVLVLGLTCVGGTIAFGLWISGQTPEGITLILDYPDDVVVGDEFDVTITIENLLDEPRLLTDLDFYDPILSGVSIVSFDPSPTNDDGVTLFGVRTVVFNQSIPAEDELVIVITMTAEQAGYFSGDVDITLDGMFSIYSTTQTIVISEP